MLKLYLGDRVENINKFKLFLLDLDGTIYFENKLIPGAKEFIEKLNQHDLNYVFMSNNSSVSRNIYLKKLKNLKLKVSENNIFSSSMAMGLYLQTEYPNKKVYLVGTKAFKKELKDYGVKLVEEEPDIVVVGYDRELNYKKLIKACTFLDNGALFLATNPDLVYPLKNKRYLPDCGSICGMITNATNKLPIYIGKPNSKMVDVIISKYNIPKAEVIIVGDRLYTDMQMGINANISSALVLSGETTEEMLENSNVKPTYVFKSIKDMIALVGKEKK